MENYDLNLIGIIASTFVGMILGALWYSPLLFGGQWMLAIGKTPQTIGSTTGPIVGSIFANLLTAIGVSIIFALVGVDTLSTGVGVGLTLGFLVVFPALLSDNLFCGWGCRLLLIQSGYRLLSILLISLTLVYLG